MEELCPQIGLECYEKNLELYDVVTTDEAFYTATPFCIMPVTKINGLKIGDGKIGETTKQLLDKWSSNVGIDIVQQIKKWDAAGGKNKLSGHSPYSFNNYEEDKF